MTDEELKSYEAHKKASAQYMKELAAKNKRIDRINNTAIVVSIIAICISIATIIIRLL